MIEKTFRLDIQSLRAISVLLVIFYHFNLVFNNHPLFSGGFIGVDIFFIISGYVISNIILIELEKKKNFDFINFLEKRLRRLVPALYFLLIIIFIFGFFLLIPESFSELSSEIISNVFILSNFYFWESLAQYGAISGMERPLLHTWSLSVEWQFYIITSLIFFLFKKKLETYFNLYFLTLFVVSFVLNFFILTNQINFNFFFSGSRYWEFVLGILIRYNQTKAIMLFRNFLDDNKINYILFISFFIIIFFSLSFQFLENQKFFFILAMISSSIIILLGNTKSYFSRFFNSKTLVFIGGISYSMYIWHYPIASFFYTTGYEYYFNNYIKLIAILPLFFISIFSYNFIENKFRNSLIINRKNFLILFISSSIFLVLLSMITIKNDGIFERIKITHHQKNFIINYDKDRKDPGFYPEAFPAIIDDTKKTILVLGNSHGGEYFELISNTKYLKQKYNMIYSHIQIRCLKNLINGINKSNCFRKLDFSKENDFQKKISLLKKVNIVILKTKWSEMDIEVLPDVIKFLKKKGIIVIVGSENPFFKIINNENFKPEKKYKSSILVHALFQKNTILDKYYISKSKLPNNQDLIKMEKEYFNKIDWERYMLNNDQLKKISTENDVIFFNDIEVFCNLAAERCDVLADNNKIHWDENGHTTFKSKLHLSNRLIKNTKLMDYL